MDRKIAEDIMRENLEMFAHLNNIMKTIERIDADEKVREMRRHIGSVLAAIDLHLFRPIVSRYPDLDPH